MLRNPATVRDFVHLITHKARIDDPDEVMLLGFERAVVEIIYAAKSDCAKWVPDGEQRQRFEAEIGLDYQGQSNDSRERLVAAMSKSEVAKKNNKDPSGADWRCGANVMFGEHVGPMLIEALSDEGLAELLTVGLSTAFHRHALSILDHLKDLGFAGIEDPILKLRNASAGQARPRRDLILTMIREGATPSQIGAALLRQRTPDGGADGVKINS